MFAGSVRSGAFSAKTADVAQQALAMHGALVTRLSLADYALPLMDEDLEKEKGVPEDARRLARQVSGHDGLLIASPEYNASMPPLLKNAIDWVSRVRSFGAREVRPFEGKIAALCSSSPGLYGGTRGLYHLRAVLMNCGVEVITPQCSVSRAAEAFDESGNFREDHHRKAMDKVAAALVDRVRADNRGPD